MTPTHLKAIEELLEWQDDYYKKECFIVDDLLKAAPAIRALLAENERMRGALGTVLKGTEYMTNEDFDLIRAALEGEVNR